MKSDIVIAILVGLVVTEAKQPPWYKPCWIYMCAVDPANPVCAWDPHHGARLFRNACEMDRHNFCYSRNYAIADSTNDGVQDIRLCDRLKQIIANADDNTQVVEDGNIRVHFLEDPNRSEKHRKTEFVDQFVGQKYRERERYEDRSRYYYDRPRHRASRYNEQNSMDRDDSSASYSSRSP